MRSDRAVTDTSTANGGSFTHILVLHTRTHEQTHTHRHTFESHQGEDTNTSKVSGNVFSIYKYMSSLWLIYVMIYAIMRFRNPV